MKYIILTDGAKEYPVLFDDKLAHIDVATGVRGEASMSGWSKTLGPLSVVAAGFVDVKTMSVTGRSESLDVGSRSQDPDVLRGAK